MDFDASRNKVAALTAPRNVVLVGASDRAGSWAPRVWRSLSRNGFPRPVFPINPNRGEIWGSACYPDFDSLPEAPDHLVVLVPAAGVPDILQAGAAAGARSATIFSAGFGEAGDSRGVEHGQRLRSVIKQTGIAVSGPNCMGNVCARSRLVTLVEDRPQALQRGSVALVGQSGGVLIFLNHTLEERGLWAEYLITSGNEVDLSLPDYIAFFAGEPGLKVVIVYVESVADPERLKAACRLARDAGKFVVAIKLGQSEAGRNAAMAHTGALAGRIEAFDAVMSECGVIRAETADDAIELAELLVRTGAPTGRRLGAVTLSGAYRGLLLDAAARNHLEFPPLAPETTTRLQSRLSVGSLVANPVDGGYAVVSSAETFIDCVDALDHDPNIDVILIQEAVPREPGNARSEKYIGLVEDYVASRARKPVAFTTIVSHGQTDHSRKLRAGAPHVSFLQEANKALHAIESVVRRAEACAIASAAISAPRVSDDPDLVRQVRAWAAGAEAPVTLDEVTSKRLFRSYGIAVPDEVLSHDVAGAIAAAERIGYPVVLKAVSAKLPHKTEAGVVRLDLRSSDAVCAGFEQIAVNASRYGVAAVMDGVLVSPFIAHGVELAIGVHRDDEMGPVVMVGAGGILVELVHDVAFAAPPITREKARDMLSRTRVAGLLRGLRGGPPLDVDAVLDALVSAGNLASELADVLEAVDINPFAVLPAGRGGIALDGLVVLRPGSRIG